MWRPKSVWLVTGDIMGSVWLAVLTITLMTVDTVDGEIHYDPITYGHAAEAPLPCLGASFKVVDWDNDGLQDLLLMPHPRYLENGDPAGTYKLLLFRNKGTRQQPLFVSFDQADELLVDKRLGRFFSTIDFDGDGRQEIVSVSRDRYIENESEQGVLYLYSNVGTPKNPDWNVRPVHDPSGSRFVPGFVGPEGLGSVTLTATDFDGDGRQDLILGTNHQDRMRHAFGTDPLQSQPTAGRVYFARNVSDDQNPVFDLPRVLQADGQPIECFGFVYPAVFDANSDGRPDLIISEHRPGLRLFLNQGTADVTSMEPAGEILFADNTPISTASAFHVEVGDLDGDGQEDLVSSSYFGSPSFFHWYRRGPDERAGWHDLGRLPMESTAHTPLSGPGISTPEPVDFDNDGDWDLVLGAEPGIPMWSQNIGTNRHKKFLPATPLKWIDGSPLETWSMQLGDGSHHGPWEWYGDRSTPRLRDWDGDNVLDIVSGTMGRRVYWMRGRLVAGELRFEEPSVFQLNGKPLLHPHRSLPDVVDYDRDGVPDLVGLDIDSNIVVYLGAGTSNLKAARRLYDTTGRPVSPTMEIRNPDINSSRSGRTGIATTDWDGDGILDLITHKHYFEGWVLLHRGLGSNRFEPPKKLFHFFSHLAGPSVIDWNQDGHLDILMGGDLRRMLGVMVSMPNPVRSHYYVYYGETLPVPSVSSKQPSSLNQSQSNSEHRAPPKRANVLFIAVDDLNDWIGVMGGNSQIRTPNFDRLARRGVLFSRAYCTAPACNPSRKSLLTGLRPSSSGLYYSSKQIRDVIPDVVTLPEHFKNNGYTVEGGGKIFHSGMNDEQSWDAYFERPRDPEPQRMPHIGVPSEHGFWRWQPLEKYGDADMADAQVVDWAQQFLKRQHEKPFFLGVGFYRPHMPWHVPQKYFEQYPLDSIVLPTVKEGDVKDLPAYARWFAYERTGLHQMIQQRDEWKRAVQAYLACISFTDAMLGQLLDALDRSPYLGNTVIVLWSDHGMHLGEKQHWTKWSLWEQATRSVLMISAPGFTVPKTECHRPVSLLDIYPTLVELCGLPMPAPCPVPGGARISLEGESLLPLLRDPTAKRRQPAITTHGHLNHAIRTDKWRYIRYRDGSEELYDHATDPREWNNLAGDPNFRRTILRLQRFLPQKNVPDPPYFDRKQYWPEDSSPNDVSDYPVSLKSR